MHINLALHTYIVQIRIHCAYQKMHVFSLIQNFSLQLAYCIAHFVSDMVFNPEYRFSHAVVISRVYYIHVL